MLKRRRNKSYHSCRHGYGFVLQKPPKPENEQAKEKSQALPHLIPSRCLCLLRKHNRIPTPPSITLLRRTFHPSFFGLLLLRPFRQHLASRPCQTRFHLLRFLLFERIPEILSVALIGTSTLENRPIWLWWNAFVSSWVKHLAVGWALKELEWRPRRFG